MKNLRTITICLTLLTIGVPPLFSQAPGSVIHEALDGNRFDPEQTAQFYPGVLYLKLAEPLLPGRTEDVLARLQASGLEIRQISSFGRPDLLFSETLQLSATRESYSSHPEYALSLYATLSYSDAVSPQAASLLLQDLPIVKIAEPVPVATLLGSSPEAPNDPRLSEQKQIEYIRAERAWAVHPGDSGTIIAIIDAGMTASHEDLFGNIRYNPGESGLDDNGQEKSSNGVDDDGNGYVDDWSGVNLVPTDGRDGGSTVNGEHGTQVCGYAAADTDNGVGIAGIANQCRFFPMKAAPYNGINIVSGMDGLLYAARAGHKVANLSWGQSTRSEIEQEIIDVVVNDYDLAVVAAGGNIIEQVAHYPAGYRGVLGVGGVDEFSTLITTWGEHLDVVALSGLTTSGTNEYFDLSSASSYATPIVSGVVALARSKWPTLPARAILQHVRYVSVDHEFANLGKEGFVGRGRVDALNAVSVDPMSHPGLVVDSVWLVDVNGDRVDGLTTGESGHLKFAITNLLGPASNTVVELDLYTRDSLDVEIGTARFEVGALESGGVYIPETGVPMTVVRPGSRALPLRFNFSASDYTEYEYERVNVQRTYTVLSGEELSVTITTSGRLGGDFTSAGIVGEGLLFQGIGQSYEGGVMLAVDEEKVLDNLRSTSQTRQNNDLLPIDPAEFPEPVLAAVRDQLEEPDYTGVSVGYTGEIVQDHPGIFRLGIAVRNESDRPFDSLRVAYFSDWDIDGLSGSQRVRRVTYPELPEHIFPVTGIVESGLLTTLLVAVEHGRRSPGDRATPLFFALNNGGDPLVIYDEFSDEEKYTILSNGIGNESAGPADVSLAVGTVFENLESEEIERFWILYVFSSDGESGAREKLESYKNATYGTGSVATGDEGGVTISPNPAVTRDILVSAEEIEAVRLVDLRGTVLLDQRFSAPVRSWNLETSGVPSGTYQLVVTARGRERAYSLIVVE